jgi:NhaP-type Na+/H+ or K+/H+ antiporter
VGLRDVRGPHRAFLACMAPRGVVAASTAALYSLRLEDIGQPSFVLTPAVFAVILVLAVVYGVGSPRTSPGPTTCRSRCTPA